MQNILKILLSPEMWAAGFVWPLTTQVLVATSMMQQGWPAVFVGAVVALTFGALVHFRGSWIWIR